MTDAEKVELAIRRVCAKSGDGFSLVRLILTQVADEIVRIEKDLAPPTAQPESQADSE